MLAILLLLTPAGHAPASAEELPSQSPTVTAGAQAPAEGDATAIDYDLIAALVAVVIITGLTALGTSLNQKFTTVSSTVNGAGGGGAPCSVAEGDTTRFSAQHSPGGQTESTAGADGVFANGGSADVATTAASDFANRVFTFGAQARVLNSTCATTGPNVKLIHELDWTLTLLADQAPPGTPPGAMAQLRMDFDFAQLAWGIGGPVPGQDGVFEIEGPDGTSWGWSMQKNPTTGLLEITSSNGPTAADFVFDSSPGPVVIQGIEFQPPEVLRGVGAGPSFYFSIPYGVATDVTFKIKSRSHTSVAGPVSVPALPLGAWLALSLALLALGWAAARRRTNELARQ